MSNSNMVLSLLIKGDGSGATRALQGISSGLGAAKTGLGALNDGAKAVTRSFMSMHRALNGFSSITKLAGGYLGVQGAMTFTSNVVALEKAMLGVKANIMSGTSSAQELQAQLKEVRETGRDLSKISMFSDATSVDVVNALLKSNVKLKDIKGTDGAAYATVALSQVGEADPKTIAANLGAMGNAFSFKSGKQYKDLANHMTKVDDASSYVGGVGALVYNAQQVSASAAALKVDPKRMISVLGYLDPLGNMAGTSFNRFLEGLAGTTKGKKAALQKSGMNFWQKNSDGTETLQDIGTVIETVRTKFKSMKSDREKLILGHKLFGEEGGRAASFFAEKAGSFTDYEKQVDGAAGATEKLGVHMEGLGASFFRLKNTAFAAIEDNTTSLQKGANWLTNKATDAIDNGHGLAMGAGVVGTAVLARLAYKKLPGMVSNWAGAGANLAGGIAMGKTLEKAAGITPVFVTNMPSGGIGGSDGKPTFRKAVTPEAILSTTTTVTTTAASLGAGVLGGGAAVAGVGLTAAATSAEMIANNPAFRRALLADQGGSGMLGAMSGDFALASAIMDAKPEDGYRGKGFIDPRLQKNNPDNPANNQEAKQLVQEIFAKMAEQARQPIQVVLDGRVIAESVNAINGRDARRN